MRNGSIGGNGTMTTLLRRPAMRRRVGVLAFALAFALPTVAHAYCRTTSKDLPAGYRITDGCFTEGLPLFWRGACVSYDVNRAAASYIPLSVAQNIIDTAFATWSNTTCGADGTPIGITAKNLGPVDCATPFYDKYGGPNQNLIVFREDAWPYSDAMNTLGLTTVSFDYDTGEIYDADIEINATSKNLSTDMIVPSDGYDLLSVVTHEAGHFFGLAHTPVTDATMYPSYRPGSSSLRVLHDDDRAGICAIYPNVNERSVDPSVSANGVLAATPCDPTPRHGFTAGCQQPPPKEESGCAASPKSSSSGAGVLGVLVALASAYLGRRRRSV